MTFLVLSLWALAVTALIGVAVLRGRKPSQARSVAMARMDNPLPEPKKARPKPPFQFTRDFIRVSGVYREASSGRLVASAGKTSKGGKVSPNGPRKVGRPTLKK